MSSTTSSTAQEKDGKQAQARATSPKPSLSQLLADAFSTISLGDSHMSSEMENAQLQPLEPPVLLRELEYPSCYHQLSTEEEVEESNDIAAEHPDKGLRLLKEFYISKDEKDFSQMAWAAFNANGVTDTVEQLHKDGADVKDGGSCGWSPLHLAVVQGDSNVAVVSLLLQLCADPNITSQRIK